MPRKLTKEEFISKAIKKFGTKYDYSKIEYENMTTKVNIICPEHGIFSITPYKFLESKYGCPMCGHSLIGKSLIKSTKDFIDECKNVHGDEYDYSNTIYHGASKKVKIICKKHGEFEQFPNNHIRGCGCPKCSFEKQSNTIRLNKDEFIEKARKIHGDKYDYSKVEYVDSHTKICIICPIHGEFWQTPNSHLIGSGCPKCGTENSAIKKLKNIDQFKEEANKVHKCKYDYSKVNYIGCDTKVCIICPKHGEFWQTPNSHLNGNGCPKCSTEKLHNLFSRKVEEFINEANKIHNQKYDYSKVEYVNEHTKVCIICPEHGEFWQTPNSHLSGHGCPKCSNEKTKKLLTLNVNDFINRCKSSHIQAYDYSKVQYKKIREKICIICPKHGEFWQEADSHMRGCDCPKCFGSVSKSENEIFEYIKNVYEGDIIQSSRNIIPPRELDIYIPDKKIAIEYNGLFWHSEKYSKDKNYHLDKLNECKKNGIKLIQIFEDEYLNNKDIVYNKILHLLKINQNLPKIMGRKCEIIEIKYNTAYDFLNKYHIQGCSKSTVYLGGYYNNELIAVMSFKREIKNGHNWELTRFASNYNYICQGVGGKLFSYFIKKYNPDEIKSFADRRWTIDEENNVYLQLGFKFDKYIKPDYAYFNSKFGCKRIHKFNFRKSKLLKMFNCDKNKSEDEITKENGILKIWNCGLIKYIWKKN